MLTQSFPSRGPTLPDDASEVVTLAGNGRAQGRVQFAPDAPRGVAPTPVGNDDSFTTLLEDGMGWNYVTYKDNYFPGSGFTEFQSEGSNDQTILALPYDAENLQGGKVNANGTWARQADDNTTQITRTAAGRYRLTVPGSTTEDGMLLLISMKPRADMPALADRAFMTYEYVNGGYIIEANTLELDLAAEFGTLDINDILTFANAFNANDPIANFFRGGGLDINDILNFASAFNAGCP